MSLIFRYWLIALLIGASLSAPICPAFAQGRTANLTVDVSGLRNYKGRVVLILWADSEETAKYPDSSAVQIRDERTNSEPCDFTHAHVCRRTIESLQNLTVSYTFRDLPIGEYAAFVFHDENNNGIPDTGIFNRPLEARGFSEVLPDDVNPIAARVDFRRARFTLAEDKNLVIGLRYPPRF